LERLYGYNPRKDEITRILTTFVFITGDITDKQAITQKRQPVCFLSIKFWKGYE
jgi:hypothetical protein